jgi:hypothetical protein
MHPRSNNLPTECGAPCVRTFFSGNHSGSESYGTFLNRGLYWLTQQLYSCGTCRVCRGMIYSVKQQESDNPRGVALVTRMQELQASRRGNQ